jgi:hypothetical protein
MVSQRELELYEMYEETRIDRELKEQIAKLPQKTQIILKELKELTQRQTND